MDALVLLAVLAIGGVVLIHDLNRGWTPHDEGVLGQAAERVLRGEVPHRDFDELYTGLLSYLNAAAFRLGGISANTLRIPLVLFTLAWLAALYRIARRFMPPVGAGLVAMICLVYSVPNYRSPMPSWYILFFATFGTLALVRWHETRRPRWLLAAGAAGGIAFLFKLSGVFYIMGGALALTAASASTGAGAPILASLRPVRTALTLGLLGAVLALAAAVSEVGANALYRFVLPFGLIAAAVAVHEWRTGGGSGRERLRQLASTLGIYLLGVAVPVVCFFALFMAAGALPALLAGTFVTPFRRLASASLRPPPVNALLWSLPLAWTLWPRREARMPHLAFGVALVWFALLLLVSGVGFRYYHAAWLTGWSIPMLVAVAVMMLALAPRETGERGRQREIAMMLGIVAVCGLLIEFPFSPPIYTLFVLPSAMLALACLVRADGRTPLASQVLVGAFFLAFGYARLMPGTINTLGVRFLPGQEDGVLSLPRATLRVRQREAMQYDAVITLVRELAEGRTLWAGPDSPEIYFLSGVPNRTRTMFELFDRSPDAALPLPQRLAHIGASLVVLKRDLASGVPPSAATIAELRVAYPHAREFPGFLVLWR